MSLFGLENIWQAVPDEYTEFKSETNQSQYIVWYSSLTWSDSHDNILLVCNDKGFFKIYEFPKNLATHYTESYPIVSPLEFNTNEEITAVEYYPSEYKDSQSYEFVVLTQSYWYKLKINNKKGKTSHGDEWIWKIGMKTKLAYPIHVFVGFMDSKAAIIIIQLINGYFNIYQQETLILSFCITGIVNKAPFCFNQNITSDFKNDCLYLAKNNNLVAISFKTINAFNKKVINETKFAWSYKVSKEIMQLKLNDSKKCIYVLTRWNLITLSQIGECLKIFASTFRCLYFDIYKKKNLQEMILICDSNNRLIIMDNFTVKWIATYETVGIAKIKVLNIGKLNGVIFTIDSTGLVKLNIAKTNIKINNVFNQKNEDFDINYAAKNYAKYKSIIDNSDIMTENTEKPKKFLKIDVEKSEITQVEGHLMLRITISITALQNITNVVVSIYHEMFQYLKNIDKLLTSLKDLTAFHESIESNDIATQEFNFKVPKKSFGIYMAIIRSHIVLEYFHLNDKYMERFDCNVFPKLTLGDWLKVDEFEKVDENKSKSVVSINLNVGNSVKDLFNAIKSNSDLSFENSSNGVFDIKELNIQICFQIDNIKVYYENYYEIFPFIKFSIQLMDFEKFFSEDSEESIFLMSQFNEAFANYFSLHNNIISMYSQVFAECHTISQEMQNFQSKFLKLIHNNSSYSHEEYTMGIKSICKNMIEISHKVDKNIQMKNESHLKLTCFTIMYELLISRNKENPLQTKLNSILDSITCNEECTKPLKQKMRIKNAYLYYNSVYKDKKPTLQNLVKMLIKD